MKKLIVLATLSLIMLGASCRRSEQSPASAEEGVLTFDAEQTASNQTDTNTMATWLASYDSGGKKAQFRIEITIPKAKREGFAFGTGAFYHDTNSSSSVLLADLAKMLQAKKPVPCPTTTNKLSFATAILGENASKGNGKDSLAGSFTSDPKGDWTVLKVFLPDGDNEGEVFLNLNSKLRKGEFTIKDPDYGDTVVLELARVL